eukprot:gene31967-33894_t
MRLGTRPNIHGRNFMAEGKFGSTDPSRTPDLQLGAWIKNAELLGPYPDVKVTVVERLFSNESAKMQLSKFSTR